MVQRIHGNQFTLASMMGGMTPKTAGAPRAAADRKFSLGRPATKVPDDGAINMKDPQQTMAVLHKAFGGDVNGPNAQNAAKALGAQPEMEGSGMLADMMKTNVQFMSLQNTIQQDNRKGASLSNSSKARHDNAVNSVRNLK